MSTELDVLRRLAELEAQVQRLSRHAGIESPPFPLAAGSGDTVPDEVVQLAKSGNTIGAMRKLQELTGVDLATAKKTVEAIG